MILPRLMSFHIIAIFTAAKYLLIKGFTPSCFSLPLGRRELIIGSGSGSGSGILFSSSKSSSSSDSGRMTSSSSSSSKQKNLLDERSTISWGIVGLGDVTQIKSGPPFWKCDGSELVAVMRRTPGKAKEFAAKVPKSKNNQECMGYDNLDDFLSHPGLEAVYVATRPGTHSEIARKVAVCNAQSKIK
jgi:hypothetical protein